MVPHSSVCAKSIQHISTYSSEIAPKDWQTADKFACRQPYSQPSLELSRHEHLHLCQPAQSPARERAGQAQVPDIDYKTTSNTRLAGRKPSCAICECTYSEIRGVFEIAPYAASGALNPDGDHARTRGSLQPDQTNREPQFCSPHLAEFLLQCLKGKQPPLPDGCAVAVSDSLAFSVAQAKAQRFCSTGRDAYLPTLQVSAVFSRGSRSIQERRWSIAGKGFSDRSTGRQSALHQRQRSQRGHISGDAE